MEVELIPAAADDRFRERFEVSFIGGMEPVLATMGMTRSQLEERMRSVGRVRIVEVDGSEAGSAWTELTGRTLHLRALLLDEAFRGRGVGAAVLSLQESNEQARRLYEKAGFHEQSARPEPGFRVLRKPLSISG
jgi:GNAT superfamily N-acetyltransferase